MELSPILVSAIELDPGADLVPASGSSLVLHPGRDESGELLVARAPELGIDTFAPTRKELVESIHENLRFLWRTFALGDPGSMTPEARRLREALLRSLVVVRHAPAK